MRKRSAFIVMMKLIVLVKPLILMMVLAITLGLLGALAASMVTIIGSVTLLEVLIPSGLNVSHLFTLMIILAIFRSILKYGEQYSNHFIAFKILALIRDLVYKKLRMLSPAKLEGKDKGNLVSLITSDIELLEVFYAHTISPIAIAVLFTIIIVVFISSYHIVLGIVALLAYISVGYVLPVVINSQSRNFGINFRNKVGELSSYLLDGLRGIKEVIQYKYSDTIISGIDKKTEELLIEEENLKKLQGNTMAASNTMIMLFNLLMLVCATYLYLNDAITFKGLVISIVTLMSTYGPVIALANLGSTLQNTIASGNRVLDLLEESPQVLEVDEGKKVSFDSMLVENVCFGYNDEKILENINIALIKNRIIGINGKSGSGKSTLLKLMMRFWDVETGKIEISNENIKSINTSNLRTLESYMTQDTHLFNDSIENNIRIAKLDATLDEIIDACKKAAIHEFITKLPLGYQTNVGELGDLISGGEKQRIGLARVFLHDADLLLLDEPTSNLDSLNEAIILKSLYEYKKNKAIILVSHRLSTLRITEEVIKVENGRMS